MTSTPSTTSSGTAWTKSRTGNSPSTGTPNVVHGRPGRDYVEKVDHRAQVVIVRVADQVVAAPRVRRLRESRRTPC